jgi:hypothetical protein
LPVWRKGLKIILAPMALKNMNREPESLGCVSSYELISRYINEYYEIDEATRRAMAQELSARHLPLPKIGEPPEPAPRGKKGQEMDQRTFLSYLLLIYTVTGLFYAWGYLPARLIKKDYQKDKRDKLIQTGIALFYQVIEIVAFLLLTD